MSFWTAVVVIVIVGVVGDIIKNRHRARHGIIVDNAGNESAMLTSRIDADAQREIEDLRERVRVLERIVTDERRGRDLAGEIESLRDK